MSNPNKECPRYEKCNVNNCPLHPVYPAITVDPDDIDQKCTMEKQVRFRIGSQYPDILKFQGLTSREWVGKQRFDSLSEAEREDIRQRASKHLLAFKTPFSSPCQSEHNDLMVMDGVI